jgi:hypothetical protein
MTGAIDEVLERAKKAKGEEEEVAVEETAE